MATITKLAVFDFDSTIVNTPLPDEGRITYKAKTGQEWPHKGWWGQADSLDIDIFDMPVVDHVVADYQRERANPNTLTVLLTGRMSKLGDLVKRVLDSKNLHFDEYHFNTGGSTDVVKINTLNSLLDKYPSVEVVELSDDRLDHIPKFEEWGKQHCLSGRLKDFKINVIISGNHKTL